MLNVATVTLQQIVEANQLGNIILQNSIGKASHFLLCLTRMKKTFAPIVEQWNDELEEKRIELASKDTEGFVLMDENKYKITADNTVKLKKFIRQLMKRELEVTTFHTTDAPDIDFNTREILSPFIFEPLFEGNILLNEK